MVAAGIKTSGLLTAVSHRWNGQSLWLIIYGYRWRVEMVMEGKTQWSLLGFFLGQCLMEVY